MPTPEEEEHVRKRASMRYWWPKLAQCDVPTPETEVIHIRDWDAATTFHEGVYQPDIDPIQEAINTVGGPPAFIRTDQASHKHGMTSASKVTDTTPDTLAEQVHNLLRHNRLAGFAGLPWRDIVVREWLDLEHAFTAFEGTPIAAEVRVFINNGSVHDSGFYWPADAITHAAQHDPTPPDDWETQLQDLRRETLNKVDSEVIPLAETVAGEFDGYWSADFARTTDGTWYCIDMAPGVASWHPDSCKRADAELEVNEDGNEH